MTVILIYGLLVVLLTVMIVSMFPVECSLARREGFQDTADAVSTCPPGTRSYLDAEGNLMCCDGQVNGRKCEGKIVCTFSQSGVKNNIYFCNTLPRVPNALEQLFTIPVKKESVTEQEIQNGNTFFKNALLVCRYMFLNSIDKNMKKEIQDDFAKLYGEEKKWNDLYAAKADTAALAKEGKYILNFYKNDKYSSVVDANMMKDIHKECLLTKSQFLDLLKSQISELEQSLKKKGIAVPN